jgi:cob(I)alamin adenosyltransferase
VKIYTKTGDSGETGLLGGDRIAKDSHRINVIGTLDELNAYVGVTLLSPLPSLVQFRLSSLQNHLFDIGSELACPPGGKFALTSVEDNHTLTLENEIDKMTSELPELKNFILPGGTPGASHLHYIRSLARRLERNLLELHRVDPIRPQLLQFVNRLSDWLFCAARYSNAKDNVSDVAWSKGT